MTEEKLQEITKQIRETIGNGSNILEQGSEDDKYKLLDIIASLHNELYKEVKGEYYDYMYHWANLGYGGEPNDSLYKDI